jgi:hypothetical protein
MASRATFGDDRSLWLGIAMRWDRLAMAAAAESLKCRRPQPQR